MKVNVSTIIDASPDKVFDIVKTKKLLFYVMHPMARFKIISPEDDFGTWEEGKTYVGWSFLFLFIPVWKRKLYIEKIDEDNRTIQSRESGEIGLKKWDHLIKVEQKKDGKTLYTDIIEINAGIFTPLYFIFASLFYRHRQRRWRALAERGFKFSSRRSLKAY
jgi:hypothetical protein